MIRDVPVGQVLERAAELWPERIALSAGDASWTFSELREGARRTAGRIAALGFGRGDHAVLWCANVPEWLFLQFGLAELGIVLVTANTALGPQDLAYQLRDCGCQLLVAGAEVKGNDLPAIVRGLDRARLPALREVVMLEAAEAPGVRDFASLPGESGAFSPAPVGVDDVINMQYTSGTTGFPKGVMLSSRNIVNNAWRVGRLLGLTPEDRSLCQVPLFHCFGCGVTVLSSFTHGASVHLTRTFDPAESLAVIERRGITVVHGVPTMFQALLDHPAAASVDASSVRTGIMAGAVCPPSLMRRLIETWRADEMTIGYGLTETSPGATFTPRSDPPELRCTSVGFPLEETEVKLVDAETGREGERGELWVRGEQVMLGYHGKPEATAETIDADGWLRTGDLAERDERGAYRIVGRIKEMILRGGENVYPAEVEETLRSFPGLAAVAVFGVPDERLGEQVACAVVPVPGQVLEPEALRSFLAERIAHTKIPAAFHLVETLPLTASGKVQRFALAERFGVGS